MKGREGVEEEGVRWREELEGEEKADVRAEEEEEEEGEGWGAVCLLVAVVVRS